ncbi:hypothetical protein BC831DRAFT_464146, partial [Entophlyctis helioformis]
MHNLRSSRIMPARHHTHSHPSLRQTAHKPHPTTVLGWTVASFIAWRRHPDIKV